jgi:ribosomal protein S8
VYTRGYNRIQLQLGALRILTQQTYNTNLILSTSKGILTHQQAIKANVGGFLILSIL